MKIEKLEGTAGRLYQLVAPLVMKPSVLRQNNNYPFKTSERYVWFVAVNKRTVVGFIPVEVRDKTAVINNYYVAGDDAEVLALLLQEVIGEYGEACKLQSVTHVRHLPVFEENGFCVSKTWKLYVKMEYHPAEKSC